MSAQCPDQPKTDNMTGRFGSGAFDVRYYA